MSTDSKKPKYKIEGNIAYVTYEVSSPVLKRLTDEGYTLVFVKEIQ